MQRSITAVLRAFALTLWLLLLSQALPSTALELREARRVSPGSAERSVALPDTWSAGAVDRASYHLHFPLAAVPQAQWALRIDRLSTAHQIYLNGHLLHENGEEADGRTRVRPLPFYLAISPSLLRAGDNELRLELQFGARGGLSTVQIGPDDDLRPTWQQDRRWDTALPQALNVGGAALSLLMLLVWVRRRQELATGLFGLLWLVASLRNYDYFVADSPLPAALSDWLYFCVQAITVCLLGLFAVALSGRPWPRLRLLYSACLVLMPVAGGLAWVADALLPLRLLVYPVLMVMCAGVARILWPLLQQQRGIALAVLLAGAAVLTGAGAHDYSYLHGWVPISGFYWVPVVLPFVLASYGAMLLDRLVLGLARSEELSQRLEQRVAERTAELAAANAEKSRFLAIASHDLRQPVAAIGLMVELAGEQVQPTHPLASAMLAKAGLAVSGLDELLRSLLDLSRLDVSPAPTALRPVPLQPLFDAIAVHAQAKAHSRKLRLRFRPTTAVALSDPLLLEQALRNLVHNALRYTESGGVLVAVRRRGARLAVEVWDSGRGIAPEHRQQIFEEFVQGSAPTSDGVGLGLAIVRRNAAALGHALGLASRPGRGSCFWIELAPVVPASQ